MPDQGREQAPCDRYEVTNGAGVCIRCGHMDDQHPKGRERAEGCDGSTVCLAPAGMHLTRCRSQMSRADLDASEGREQEHHPLCDSRRDTESGPYLPCSCVGREQWPCCGHCRSEDGGCDWQDRHVSPCGLCRRPLICAGSQEHDRELCDCTATAREQTDLDALRNDYDTCRMDWKHLWHWLAVKQQERVNGSRDFGRGYALAMKDVKEEMSRLDNFTPPRDV